MRVLIFSTIFFPEVSGPSVYVREVSKVLAKKGFSVDILCPGEYISFENFGKIKINRFKKPKNVNGIKNLYQWYKNHSEEILSLVGLDYDFIITTTHLMLGGLKKRFLNAQIFWKIPSLMLFSEDFTTRKEINENIKLIKELSKGVILIFPSEFLRKEFFIKIKAKRESYVIPNGVDFNRFKPGFLRKNWVIYLGRFSREKNLSVLSDVFKEVGQNSKIVLVGELIDNYKKMFERLISSLGNRVFLFRKTPHPENYLKKSRILVLPSLYESFGNVLLEAMACGVPSVAFMPDGDKIKTASNELIINGKNGFLVKDKKEMAEKINLLLKDKKLWKKMSKDSIKLSKKYSWENHVNNILNIFKTKN